MSDQSMIHRMMYDTSIDECPSFSVDLESIFLLLASILLAVVVTAELNLFCCGMHLIALASDSVGYI